MERDAWGRADSTSGLRGGCGFAGGTEQSPERGCDEVVKGSDGEVPLSVPRTGGQLRAGIKKGQTRIDGVDDKIIGLYAAGLSVRDIRAHLECDLYGLVSVCVTDAVLDEVREWQHWALDRCIRSG